MNSLLLGLEQWTYMLVYHADNRSLTLIPYRTRSIRISWRL